MNVGGVKNCWAKVDAQGGYALGNIICCKFHHCKRCSRTTFKKTSV